MLLYIVRHGIAIDRDDPKAPAEAERPLTAQGVEKTRAAAKGLRTLELKPGYLLSSPFVRALQTAEIFAEAFDFPTSKIQKCDALKPAAAPAEIVRQLAVLKAKQVMCFGHAPHIDRLVAQLAGMHQPATEVKKASVTCFEHDHGKWKLVWMLTPKILRKLSG